MLLLDAHLSPRLCGLLDEEFPGCSHVFDLALGEADDVAVWEAARQRGLMIVTKDSDFPDLQGVRGFPPKVIWLRLGNCPTRKIEGTLRHHQGDVQNLADNPDLGLLIIR